MVAVCPQFDFQISYQDGSSFDDSVFTFNTVTNQFEIKTDDVTKTNEYPMVLWVKFRDTVDTIYTNQGELDFTV